MSLNILYLLGILNHW